VHHHRLLPLRRRGRGDRTIPGCAHPPTSGRLRVPRRRSRPQQGRRHLGGRVNAGIVKRVGPHTLRHHA
jgi:hypothetical protein